MKIETRLRILRKIQPACEDLGFIVGGILGSADLLGGEKGIEYVEKKFESYYKKHSIEPSNSNSALPYT